MLEIKSYDDWTNTEEQLQADPADNLKNYANYVRSGYYKAGMLNEDNEREIISGVQERAISDGLIAEDASEEEQNSFFGSIVGPSQNSDTNARFVLDHLRTGSESGVDPNDAKVATLNRYLALKPNAPEQVSDLQPLVDEMLADKSLVKRAKMSAVDRGEYSVAAIDEDDGSRSLYTGPTAKPDSVKGEVDSLLASGAISTSDLYRIDQSVKPINGGLSNTSESFRFDMFRRTVGELAKNDKDLGDLIQSSASAKREAKIAEQRTTGEAVLEGVKTAVSYPFIKLGEAVVGAGEFLMGKEAIEPAYAPDTNVSDILAGNDEIRKKFSAEEIEKFSNDLTTTAAGAVYRADRPETGIGTDSMGNTIIAPQLLANKQAFETAVTAAPLNKEQQKQARFERGVLLEQNAPDLKRVILEEEPEAVGAYAKAKADGLTDAQFVEQWVGDSKNYDGFNTRLEQFGKSAWKTVAEIPVGIAALSGNEQAAKYMGDMAKDQSRREEYAKLFGDQFGLGFQIINTVPQVATDIALTIGTGGVFAGAKTLAKTGALSAKSMLRTSTKFALSNVDEAAASAFKTAAAAGGEAGIGNAIKSVGTSLATKFAEQSPVFTTSFIRSATSTYGSLYNQLPDTMSHDEKHKNALGYAMAAGLSTGVITSGMGLLGRGGVEEIATKRVRAMLAGETEESVLASGGKVVPVDKMNYRQSKQVYENLKNEGAIVSDAAFQKAMRGAIGSTYKNWLRTTIGGALNESVEEAIDQGIQMKLEESALDKETPLSEKVAQVFTAGIIGGVLGGVTSGATQFGRVNKSEQALVFEGRASALEGVAKRLRETNSNATADYVQRMIDDARAKANAATQADLQAQKASEMRAQSERVVDGTEKQLTNIPEEEVEMSMLGDLVGQRATAAGVTGVLEEGDDGMIRITSKNGDILNLGSRYEKASGRVSRYPKLMTTAMVQGDIPAGTPYVTRGRKDSTKIAMPSVTDTNKPQDFLGVIRDEDGKVVQLVVKNAPMVSNPEFTMDLKISNGYQINSLARYYNVELNTLNDLTPVSEEAAVDTEGTPVEQDGADDLDTIASGATTDSDKQSIAAAQDVLRSTVDVSDNYKLFMAGDSSKPKFKQLVSALSPQDLDVLSNQATNLYDWLQSDETMSPKAKKQLLRSAEEFKSRVSLAYNIQANNVEAENTDESNLSDEELASLEAELDADVNGVPEEEEVVPQTEDISAEPKAQTPNKDKPVAPKRTVSSVITPEGNEVLSDSEVLAQRKAIIDQLNSLEDTALVVKTDRGLLKLSSALRLKSQIESFIDITTSDEGLQVFNTQLAALNKSISNGKRAITSRRIRLKKALAASLALDEDSGDGPTITEAAAQQAQILSTIFNTPKPIAEQAPPKPVKIKREAGEDWSTEDKLRLFRNNEEELAFNDLADSGFLISDLSRYGASVSGKLQQELGFGDVPLFTKKRLADDPTNPNLYLKGKHILLRREVLSRFPLVAVDTGYTLVKSKRNYTDPEKGTYRALDLPVFRDAELNIIGGAFTNDVNVTRNQIDQNIEVYVPKDLIEKSNDVKDPFKLNPSIDIDPVSGRVMSVIDPITREPIRFTGDSTSIVWEGYNGYMPVRGKQVMSLLSGMLTVSATKLTNAGPTATGRTAIEGRGIPVKEYTKDFINFLSGSYEQESGKPQTGIGYKLLKKEYGLDQNSINDLSSFALGDYILNLNEYAIGTQLASVAAKALQFVSEVPQSAVAKIVAKENNITLKELRAREDYRALLDAKSSQLAKNTGLLGRVKAVADETGFTVEELRERNDFHTLVGLNASTLKDIDSVKVVSNFFASKSIDSIARSILTRYPKLSGGPPQAVVSKYAEYLFNRVNTPEGDLYTGIVSPEKVIRYYGDLYQRMEINSNSSRTVRFGDIGENIPALNLLSSDGKFNSNALDPLFVASREKASDFSEAFAEYGDNLRNSLIKSVDETPELRDAFRNIASMFDENLANLSNEKLIDSLGDLMSNFGGENRNLALLIVNYLYAGRLESGLRAAGIMSELGWLPPVAGIEAVAPTIEVSDELESPTAPKEDLIRLIASAKEKAYRAVGAPTPEEEVVYRRRILEGVMFAEPQILEASAKAEGFQRTAELDQRYGDSVRRVIDSIDSLSLGEDPTQFAITKFSSDISSAQQQLSDLDARLGPIGVDIDNASALVTRLEGGIKKLSEAKKPKATRKTATTTADLNVLKSARDLAVGNLKGLQREQQSILRNQDVLQKFIDRIAPTLDNLQNNPLAMSDFVSGLRKELNAAETRATHYTKASQASKDLARTIARKTPSEAQHQTIIKNEKALAARAARQLHATASQQFKAANDVNSESTERAARQKNTEDMIKYGLQSNDPDSVLDTLRILSKSKVESHREVAKLLLLAPDFIKSVRFGIVDLRTDWAGIFDAGTNTVLVNLAGHNGRGLADVLLHEYLHAATVSYFTNPTTAEQRAAVTRINQLRELAIVQATKKGVMRFAHVRTALASNEEFLTATLTAPDFQATLATLSPVGQRSLVGRIVDTIIALFGKKNTLLSKAVKELLDFSEMSLANFHTYNNSMKRNYNALSESAQTVRADSEDRMYLNDLLDDIQNGRPEDFYKAPTQDNVGPVDVVSEMQRILPEGVTFEFDNTMLGQLGARRSRPNSIIVNPDTANDLVYGLTPANARSAVRTFVDEELAHLASYRTFTEDDFANIAASMGDGMRGLVADMLYSNSESDYTKRQAMIAADLESGALRESDIAAEWVRSEMTRIAVGRSREENLSFLRTNPSLLAKFVEAVRAFVTKLKAQFATNPTASTAAKISMASREFRSLRNGGVLSAPEPSTAGELGDTTHFINAVEGNIVEGQEDRTSFNLPIASTNPSKVADFWKKAQQKMYDMPLELRKYVAQRDGAISNIEYTMQDFSKKYPKLRDQALSAGVAIEDIGTILGTTAPAVQGEAFKELKKKVRQFKADNAEDPNVTRLAEDYEEKLAQPIADQFYAAFRKEQMAMENQLRARGFGALVDYLVEFRQEINKYKQIINFDDTNDVYLTRTFKYFSTEGWANAALNGGVIEVDGKTIDFNKLRAAATVHFEAEVINDAKNEGQTLTEDQLATRTLKALDNYLRDLDKRARESKELGTMNTIKRDVNRLLRKKNIDEPLRELLGEVTDPFENAVRTIYSVGRLAANDRFLRNFARQAIKSELASYEYKNGMELLFHPSQNAELGELAGLYVRSDVAAAVRQELGPKGRDQETRSAEVINGIGRAMAKVSGLAVTTQTLGSVGFYPRNILGGMALSSAQGIINPLYAKEATRLALMANLFPADSQETRDTIRRLTELQILRDETRGRIAMDMFRGFATSTDEQLEALLNDVVEAQSTGNVDKLAKKFNIKKGGQATVEFLASLNNVIDSAFKVNAYMYELDQLKKAYGNESIGSLEVQAARKVKLTFPTHSDQISFAKSFNKSPFAMVVLPFIRWKSEVLRTMINTVPLAMEEINSGNDVMKARGIKRLIGFSSTVLGGGTAFGLVFGTLFSLLTGGKDDEDKELGRVLTNEELSTLREGLPDWQKNHGVFARLVGKDGIQVIDMSNILPHSQLTDIVKLGAQGNVKGIGEYIAKDLIGTQIAANALFEVSKNQDGFGNPIALQSDNIAQAYGKLLVHAAKSAFAPSVIKKGIEVLRYGQQDAGLLIAGELTGARPTVMKKSDIEYRGMSKIRTAMDEDLALLNPIYSAKGFDVGDVGDQVGKYQSATNVTQGRLYDFIQGMKSLGSTEEGLITTGKRARISNQRLGYAIAGENYSWVPNEAAFKKIIENKTRGGEQDPMPLVDELIRVTVPNKPINYNVAQPFIK